MFDQANPSHKGPNICGKTSGEDADVLIVAESERELRVEDFRGLEIYSTIGLEQSSHSFGFSKSQGLVLSPSGADMDVSRVALEDEWRS